MLDTGEFHFHARVPPNFALITTAAPDMTYLWDNIKILSSGG